MTEPAAPPARFTKPRVAIPFLLIAVIWGSTWLVIKDQISVVPPSWTIAYRFAIASVGMLVLLAVRRERLRVSRAAWPVALIVGLTQFVANFHFVYRAEAYITSGIVALFFALIMIPNSILAWFVLKERVSAGFVAGSVVAIVGVGLLLRHEFAIAGTGAGADGVLLGSLLAVLATLAASIANVAQATPRAQAEPFVPLLTLSMLTGTAINVGIALAFDGPPVWDTRQAYLGGLLYLGLVGSVVTFTLYFTLIRRMGAGRAAYIGVVTPVLAMVLSTAFEGYRWTALAVAGAVLALAGLVIALKARG